MRKSGRERGLPLVQCWNLTEFVPLVEIPKSWESFFSFSFLFFAPLFKD
jgi:hypothetical protein